MTDIAAIKDELRALLAAAPDGPPWIRRWESLDVHGMRGDGVLADQRNIDLIVAAVNALPALLADTPSVEPPITSDDIDKFTDEQFTAFMHASGFDARIDAALAEAHAGKLPLYRRAETPSVEPAGTEWWRHATGCETRYGSEADCTCGLTAFRSALPTQASDSPEKTTALAILDVIDGIVDDTHPEGDGCPLCAALDELRDVLGGATR